MKVERRCVYNQQQQQRRQRLKQQQQRPCLESGLLEMAWQRTWERGRSGACVKIWVSGLCVWMWVHACEMARVHECVRASMCVCVIVKVVQQHRMVFLLSWWGLVAEWGFAGSVSKVLIAAVKKTNLAVMTTQVFLPALMWTVRIALQSNFCCSTCKVLRSDIRVQYCGRHSKMKLFEKFYDSNKSSAQSYFATVEANA